MKNENNEIRDFSYHEFKTNSDDFVKDIATLLALGNTTKEARDISKNLKKASVPSKDECWNIVYPNPDFTLLNTTRTITSFEDINSKEYEIVTRDQISHITDTVILRAQTRPKDRIIDSDNIDTTLDEEIGDISKDSATMYLEIYMPKYLCDTELQDPTQQRDGVTIPKLINKKSGEQNAQVRNYHNCFMRIFDNPNEDYSGPAENEIDMVTGDISKFNSASSEWTKLSWFTDFENIFKEDLGIDGSGALRVPVTSSLNNKTKIKVYANIHPNRAIITVVGNPNIDYGDNRYLIGQAYIGAVDSFDFSKADVVGNFGIYTTSSSVPAIPKFKKSYSDTFDGIKTLGSDNNKTPKKIKISTDSDFQEENRTYSTGIKIGTIPFLDAIYGKNRPADEVINYKYHKRNIPRNFDLNIAGGQTTIYTPSIKLVVGSSKSTYTQNIGYYDLIRTNLITTANRNNYSIVSRVYLSPDKYTYPGDFPIKYKLEDKGEYIDINVTYNLQDIYYYLLKFIKPIDTDNYATTIGFQMYSDSYLNSSTYLVDNSSYANSVGLNANVYLLFDEVEERNIQTGGCDRDKYGNLIVCNYQNTYGESTANGTTDFAMYMTASNDYFQKHYFMFSSTEQFMKKYQYGKSAFTDEFFADRIKICHTSEGVRGLLSGLIVIDAESLYPFDELIVNKDFTKYKDRPQETYVYLPLTTPYTPFANSPNERYGTGLEKELKYLEYDDNSKCDGALREVQETHKDIYSVTNGESSVYLLDVSENELDIKWESDDENTLLISTGAEADERRKTLIITNFDDAITVNKDEKVTIQCNYDDTQLEDNRKANWSSSDERIFTVDEKGVITGIMPGKAILTVRHKCIKATMLVRVTEPEPTQEPGA